MDHATLGGAVTSAKDVPLLELQLRLFRRLQKRGQELGFGTLQPTLTFHRGVLTKYELTIGPGMVERVTLEDVKEE